MYVFEITTPGTWLDYEDEKWAWQTGTLLHSLTTHFFEANAALNLFAFDQSRMGVPRADRDQWDRDAARRSELEEQVAAELGVSRYSFDSWERIRIEAEIRFKREQWAAGRSPSEIHHQIPFIHARAFLYALSAFEKLLVVLAGDGAAPPGVPNALDDMRQAFPDLHGVRNSAQHHEDRIRGLDQRLKPINLQPVDTPMVKAPGGALILNSLNGTRFGSTMADGTFGEVDVSPQSLQALQTILHSVLASYRWKGPAHHVPGVR